MFGTTYILLLTLFSGLVQAAPTVKLDDSTVIGSEGPGGTTSQFLGLRFAEPVNGTNRLNLPVINQPYTGTIDATSFSPGCPQQETSIPGLESLPNATLAVLNELFGELITSSEDCLFINVVTPAGSTLGDDLPVLVWIYGGGFASGDAATYPGSNIVDSSLLIGTPVVYVSMNYRLNGFGFLASQEVKDAGLGNLGLQDQRLAFQWVQKYIKSFGGDPTKVTIWGESAGSISVALHMVTNGGNPEGLFRGAFMESGSPISATDITAGQPFYDSIVLATGCSGSSDTLQCLREVEFETLLDAINQTPNIFDFQSLELAWTPRTDGVFLTADPQLLVLEGSVANIPFVNGDCDDEGTLFSLTLLNLTTDAEALNYIQSNYLSNTTSAEINTLASAYPSNPVDGSPFDTGDLNAITPEFKRLAAIQGDLIFQAPRRLFIQTQSGKQNLWTYDNKVLKDLPVLGSAHGTDILNIYFGGTMTPYLINFANNLNPNGIDLVEWPVYTKENPHMLIFQDDPALPVILGADTFREEGISLLTHLSLNLPI